jgi:hypothetical protein
MMTMSGKRPWVEPVVRSIDELALVLGICDVGSSPSATGDKNCQAGNGASKGICTNGTGAKTTCLTGTSVK